MAAEKARDERMMSSRSSIRHENRYVIVSYALCQSPVTILGHRVFSADTSFEVGSLHYSTITQMITFYTQMKPDRFISKSNNVTTKSQLLVEST